MITGFTFLAWSHGYDGSICIFLPVSMNSVDSKWRTSLLVSGFNYIYCCSSLHVHERCSLQQVTLPTVFRYVDWILTVPLMCVEFYLILKVAGAKKSTHVEINWILQL